MLVRISGHDEMRAVATTCGDELRVVTTRCDYEPRTVTARRDYELRAGCDALQGVTVS